MVKQNALLLLFTVFFTLSRPARGYLIKPLRLQRYNKKVTLANICAIFSQNPPFLCFARSPVSSGDIMDAKVLLFLHMCKFI